MGSVSTLVVDVVSSKSSATICELEESTSMVGGGGLGVGGIEELEEDTDSGSDICTV